MLISSLTTCSGNLEIRVQHFSRYRLVDDDSDDEEEEPASTVANQAAVLPTTQEPTAALVDFEAGERGERSPVMQKYASPTRFVVPRDDDDDTDVEMMTTKMLRLLGIRYGRTLALYQIRLRRHTNLPVSE